MDIDATITIRGADNLPHRFTPLNLTLDEHAADISALAAWRNNPSVKRL